MDLLTAAVILVALCALFWWYIRKLSQNDILTYEVQGDYLWCLTCHRHYEGDGPCPYCRHDAMTKEHWATANRHFGICWAGHPEWERMMEDPEYRIEQLERYGKS